MKNKGMKFAKKALQSRPRRFSVIWMLPNFLTICALIFGLQAMYQAIFNNWDNVIIMIIIASVFDMLDGRVARLLKSTSEFGMHLDSLSDFVDTVHNKNRVESICNELATEAIIVLSSLMYRITRTKRMTRTKRRTRRIRMKLTFGPVLPTENSMTSSPHRSQKMKTNR